MERKEKTMGWRRKKEGPKNKIEECVEEKSRLVKERKGRRKELRGEEGKRGLWRPWVPTGERKKKWWRMANRQVG